MHFVRLSKSLILLKCPDLKSSDRTSASTTLDLHLAVPERAAANDHFHYQLICQVLY